MERIKYLGIYLPKANRVLPRECTGQSKHPLPTTQEKTLHIDITRWSIPKSDWLYSLQPKMEKLYIVSKNKTRSWLWLRPWTRYYQVRLKLKKVGKTTRPFRYDLNQIPYDYIVEVTNRFKGLDLIECLKNYGWRFMTLYRNQRSRPSSIKIKPVTVFIVSPWICHEGMEWNIMIFIFFYLYIPYQDHP